MLPVLVAAHEDQPDVGYGRGGPVRMDFISASDQGGVKAIGSSVESPKGLVQKGLDMSIGRSLWIYPVTKFW